VWLAWSNLELESAECTQTLHGRGLNGDHDGSGDTNHRTEQTMQKGGCRVFLSFPL